MKNGFCRWVVILAVVVLYSAWSALPVSAHALLVRSNPPANASLPRSPAQVELYFSETVQSGLSSIKVLDTNGLVVDLGDVQVDPDNPARMSVSLHSLVDGVYTVSWKAISATDGHLTTGSFPFAVGTAESLAQVGARQETKNTSLSASALSAKWLLLASLLLLLGRLPFTLFVWYPSLLQNGGFRSYPENEPASWRVLTQLGMISLLVSIGLGVLSQAGQAAGRELALPWAPEMGQILLGSRLGLIWLVRILLAVIAIWLVLSPQSAWKSWLVFLAAAALLFTESLTSHAASEPLPLLPLLMDWVHLLAMSFWVGGLAYFVSGLREIRQIEGKQRTAFTSSLIVHFSTLALICVSLLGISGIYSAYLRLGTLAALMDTLYGHALLLKLGVAALLVSLGAVNLLLISPRLRRDRANGASNLRVVARFSKIVMAELILASIVLFNASLLSSLPPARITATSTDLSGSEQVDDLHMDLNITPGRVGINTFTLSLSSNGQSVRLVKEALLRFTPERTSLPPSEAQLIGHGDGTFTAKGSYLSLPDSWQVQSVVRRANKFDAYANFNFSVQNSASTERPFANMQVAGGLLLLIGMVLALLLVRLAARRMLRTAAGGLLSIAVIGLGVIFLTRPLPAAGGLVNPIPPNSQSVIVGKALYIHSCATCHGDSGKGDGPLGMTMLPRPADLTQHAVPGVHTDAQLFQWITDGFPASRMPPFRSTLSDTDRWNLVNFIRTMAPK